MRRNINTDANLSVYCNKLTIHKFTFSGSHDLTSTRITIYDSLQISIVHSNIASPRNISVAALYVPSLLFRVDRQFRRIAPDLPPDGQISHICFDIFFLTAYIIHRVCCICNLVICRAHSSRLFPAEVDSLGAFRLRPKSGGFGEAHIFLPLYLQPDLISLQRLGVPGGFIHKNLPLLPPHGCLQPSLPLCGLITGVVPTVVCNARFVLLPHLLQLFGAVLRGG